MIKFVSNWAYPKSDRLLLIYIFSTKWIITKNDIDFIQDRMSDITNNELDQVIVSNSFTYPLDTIKFVDPFELANLDPYKVREFEKCAENPIVNQLQSLSTNLMWITSVDTEDIQSILDQVFENYKEHDNYEITKQEIHAILIVLYDLWLKEQFESTSVIWEYWEIIAEKINYFNLAQKSKIVWDTRIEDFLKETDGIPAKESIKKTFWVDISFNKITKVVQSPILNIEICGISYDLGILTSLELNGVFTDISESKKAKYINILVDALKSNKCTIKRLNLEWNSMWFELWKIVAEWLFFNNSVDEIILANNNLTAIWFWHFLYAANRKRNIKTIDFSNNDVWSIAWNLETITNILKDNESNIEEIDFSYNDIWDEWAKLFANVIESKKLRRLNISHNNISKKWIKMILNAMNTVNCSWVLNIEWNNIWYWNSKRIMILNNKWRNIVY